MSQETQNDQISVNPVFAEVNLEATSEKVPDYNVNHQEEVDVIKTGQQGTPPPLHSPREGGQWATEEVKAASGYTFPTKMKEFLLGGP